MGSGVTGHRSADGQYAKQKNSSSDLHHERPRLGRMTGQNQHSQEARILELVKGLKLNLSTCSIGSHTIPTKRLNF